MTDLNYKKCSNCFEVKPVNNFYKKLQSYQSRCKECNAEVVRGYAKRLREKKRDLILLKSGIEFASR